MNKTNPSVMNRSKNIVSDPWLGGVLERKVYKIIVDDALIKGARDKRDDENGFLQILRKKPVFLYAKIPSQSIDHIKFLEENGFRLVDTNITFEKSALSPHAPAGNCEVRFALPGDEAQAVEVAKRSFVYSRFHLDPAFSNEAADKVKAEWVRNFFLGRRGEAMVVALVDKAIIGFLQLLQSDDGLLTIDQIAVSSAYRKQGIADNMISYAEGHCKNVQRVRVGTQIVNIPSMRLYEGMGFKVSETSYVFHYHNV